MAVRAFRKVTCNLLSSMFAAMSKVILRSPFKQSDLISNRVKVTRIHCEKVRFGVVEAPAAAPPSLHTKACLQWLCT